MIIGSKRRFGGFMIQIGRDYWTDSALVVTMAFGFRKVDCQGELPWSHYWRWSSASLPCLIFRQWRWRGHKFTLPIGVRVNGYCRIFWGY